MQRRLLLLALVFTVTLPATAQQEGLLRLGDDVHRFLLRQQAAGRLPEAHLAHLPLSAYEAGAYLDTLASRSDELPALDRALLARFRGEAPAPGARWVQRQTSAFYENGQTFFTTSGDGYALHVEPLVYLAYGRARHQSFDDADSGTPVWRNTRGVRAAGRLGRYVFFESSVEETEERVPFPSLRQKTAPRLPFVRPGDGVYDYQLATGVVGIRSRFVEARFGRDRNQWATGASSLFLSNYAPAYDALQVRTTVGPVQYVNLFTALHDLSTLPERFSDRLLPRKYASLHHLSIRLTDRVQVGFFQGVVFATDTTETRERTGFDIAYLNPFLFTRAAEADRGSADNALLGADAAVRIGPGRVYGQLLLDEFHTSTLGKAWWGNKWGWLAGVESARLGPLGHVRLEYARLRPYLYSHRAAFNAFTHYNDVLGHPAGPNSSSFLATVHTWLTPRMPATFALFHVRQGRGAEGENVGADPLQPYTTRVREWGVEQLDGVRRRTIQVEGTVSYELLPGLHAGAAVRAHHERDAELGHRTYVAPTLLLRWGLPYTFVAL